MSLLTINVSVNEAELPEWMPPDLLRECVEELRRAGEEFTKKAGEIQARYNDKVRERLGKNVVAFHRKERT